MAAPGVSRLPLTRTVKKVEKPRPLKSCQSKPTGDILRLNTYEEVMKLADSVVAQLRNNTQDDRNDILQNITSLASHLKLYGQQLEGIYGDQLDRTFTALRNFANDETFDVLVRLRLLELIELRAMHWTSTEDALAYYQLKFGKVDNDKSPDTPTPIIQTPVPNTLPSPGGATSPSTLQILGPGEVIKPSGKYALPTKVPGKSYLKDEVVIRNADSGKVMGIKGRRVHMIEELSETIISFQRVNPGAKERLVQITGPSEESINYARHLMEDTIRRNASPTRADDVTMGSNSSLNSSASDEKPRFIDGSRVGARRSLIHSLSTNDASVGEYKYTVVVGTTSLRITGPDLKLVRAAKLALDEYFAKSNWQALEQGEDFTTIEEDHLLMSEGESNEVPDTPVQINGVASPQCVAVSNVTEKKEQIPKTPDTVNVPPGKATSRIIYTREFLLSCSQSAFAKQALPNWWNIARQYPGVARKNPCKFDVEAFMKQSMNFTVCTDTDSTDAE